MNESRHHYFASCPRGLEQLLHKELQSLGAEQVFTVDGGVGFQGDLSVCYRANLHSRLASRVLMQMATGNYRNEDELYQATLALDWPDFFDVQHDFLVKVTAIKCPLKSLNFVTLKIKDAICDRFRHRLGKRPNVNTEHPVVRVHLFLSAQRYQLYLDTSGAALYQRGHRKSSVLAPVRENLAAGILMLAGWRPNIPLLDGMCGSGTFLLEATMMALNIAPGLKRRFAFEYLNNFDPKIWNHLHTEAQSLVRPVVLQTILGSDYDPRAIRATRNNLLEAGLLAAVQVQHGDIREARATQAEGILIANPPYGVRLGEEDKLLGLYAEIGTRLKQEFAGWRAYFLTTDMRLPRGLGLKESRRTLLFNGALECRLFEFVLVAGQYRKPKRLTEE